MNETLGEEIEYQIKNAINAQSIMTKRLSVLSDYFSSRKRTESSLRNVERLKSSSNIDRNQANDAIAELEYVSTISSLFICLLFTLFFYLCEKNNKQTKTKQARRIEQDALQRY